LNEANTSDLTIHKRIRRRHSDDSNLVSVSSTRSKQSETSLIGGRSESKRKLRSRKNSVLSEEETMQVEDTDIFDSPKKQRLRRQHVSVDDAKENEILNSKKKTKQNACRNENENESKSKS